MAENTATKVVKEEVVDTLEVIALKAKLAKAEEVATQAIIDKKIAEGIAKGLKEAGIAKVVSAPKFIPSTMKVRSASDKDQTPSEIITPESK